MANGLPAAEAHALAATQRPIETSALTQKSGVPAWKTIPSWAVVGTADHAIPLALQLAMARTAHAHVTTGGRISPFHDLQSRHRDESDPASRPADLLTETFA